jgi:hypothetical protein
MLTILQRESPRIRAHADEVLVCATPAAFASALEEGRDLSELLVTARHAAPRGGHGQAIAVFLVVVAGVALAAGWALARARDARRASGDMRSAASTTDDDAIDPEPAGGAGGGIPSEAALEGLRTRMHTSGGSGTGAGDLVASPDRAIGATAEAIGAGTEPQTPTGDATATIVGQSGEPLTTSGRPAGRPPVNR